MTTGPTRSIRSRAVVLAAAVAAATTLAACGSSSPSSHGTGATGGGSSTKATGSPIVVGLINEQAGATAVPEYAQGIETAADYINSLGGVDNHPLKIDLCGTDGTPASTQACAQQFVSSKPLFVTVGLDNNLDVAYPLLAAAGIPILGGTPTSLTDYTAKDARYFVGGALAAIAGMAGYIHQFQPQIKNVGIAVFNLAVGMQAVPVLQKPLQAEGVKVEVVPFSPTATNLLPAFVSLKNDGAQEIAALTTQQECVELAQAGQSQNTTIKFITASPCFSPAIMKQAGSAMKGWVIGGFGPVFSGNDPEVEVYRAQMQKYEGSSAIINSYSELGFGTTMTIYQDILKPLGFSKLTGTALITQADSPAGGTGYLQAPYKCQQNKTFTSICGFSTQWYTIASASGALTSATNGQYVDAAAALGG